MSDICEAVITAYHPFTIGGAVNQTEQCKQVATHVVAEKSSNQTMPLCSGCLEQFWRLNTGDEKLYAVSAIKGEGK